MTTDALIRELADQVRPVSPLRRPLVRFARWVALAAPWLTWGVVAIGPRSDLAAVTRVPAFVWSVAAPMALGLMAVVAAFGASVPDRKNRLSTLVAVVALGSWLALVAGEVVQGGGGQVAGAGLKCVRNLSMLSVPPAALLYFMLRRAAPLDRGWTGLLTGLGVAALAHTGTRFVCHNDGGLHILLWHGAFVLLLGALGLVVGRVVFR